jgi:MoxR-like ATPase
VQSAKALAVLRGRDYVLPVDVADLAVDVLAHRLVLTYEALAEEVAATEVVRQVLEQVDPPQVAPSQTAEQPVQHRPRRRVTAVGGTRVRAA